MQYIVHVWLILTYLFTFLLAKKIHKLAFIDLSDPDPWQNARDGLTCHFMSNSNSIILEASIIIPVACAIIEGPAGVLCAQRSATMSLPLAWEFPGGKIESGETAELALLREIREELQVDIIIGQALTYADHSYVEGRVIRLFPFVCRLVDGGDPIPREHAALRWVMREELRSLDWAAADVPVLEGYLKSILFI